MNVYLDAGALVKAFMFEEGSDALLELLSEATFTSTSRISYVECHAAFARGRRDGRLTSAQLSEAARKLDAGWTALVILELDAGLAERAGVIAHDLALRAGDAIHLASAEIFGGASPAGIRFTCWDRRLREAAAARGLSVAPAALPS